MKIELYISGEKVDETWIDKKKCKGYLWIREKVIEEGNKLLLKHQRQIILKSYEWEIWIVVVSKMNFGLYDHRNKEI